MSYFVQHDGQQLGPFTEAEVKAKLASGAIAATDYIWWEGQTEWMPLGQTALGIPAGLPPAPPAFAPGVPPKPGKTSGLAIGALVCGILGFFFSIFAGIPAIVMGHLSLSRIRRDPTIGGHGVALAGTILGYLSLVMLPVVAISMLIALGNQVKGTMNTINAQVQAAQTNDASSTSSDSSSSTNAPTTNAPASNQ